MTQEEIRNSLTLNEQFACMVLSHLEYDDNDHFEGHDEVNKKVLEIAKEFLDSDPVEFIFRVLSMEDEEQDLDELIDFLQPLRKLL